MEIKTFKEIGKDFDDIVQVNSMNGVPVQYIAKAVDELHKKKWIAIDDELDEAIALYRHLRNHPEVKDAPVNKGQPMCKICNKTAKQILEENKQIEVKPTK